MITAVKTRRAGSGGLRELFDSLSPEKKRTIIELTQDYLRSVDRDEQVEISKTMYEILFPASIGGLASFATASFDARKKLERYRASIAKAVRERREELGMSQVELSEKAGLPQSHISRIENGVHTTTHLTIQKLASALKTKPSRLDPGSED
jgi:DNA-binding XRE family transcriptional regulator